MKNGKMKKYMTGLCTAAILAAMPVLTVHAAEQKLNDATPAGNTDVTATVTSPGTVSYIISIPDKVDFGTIQQPNTDENALVEQTFTVACEDANGLQAAQAIAVMVKDETAGTSLDPFVLSNEAHADSKMTYQMINPVGDDIATATWYANGFIFNTFTGAGQSATGKLVLNRNQLYNKGSEYQGAYSGKLNFYTKIANVHSS